MLSSTFKVASAGMIVIDTACETDMVCEGSNGCEGESVALV